MLLKKINNFLHLRIQLLIFKIKDFRKIFISKFIYKYLPDIFLLAKFSNLNNPNSEKYWSATHAKEAKINVRRFDQKVLKYLNNIDFKNKRILDVGCGQGFFLNQLKETKFKYGIDISKAAVNIAREKDIKAYQRELPEIKLNQTFDIITCFETLEHTKHWQKSIINMIKILKNDGYLIISVPFEKSIVIQEHITYFDLERLYGFLKNKISVLEIKIIGPWLLIIALNTPKMALKLDYFKYKD